MSEEEEESEIYARNLRTRLAQNIYRLSMAGRNLKIRLGYITPRIANLSTELIELSGQRYHVFSNEENSMRKLRKMYGKEWIEKIKKLDVGEFVYVHTNRDPKQIRVPLFTSKTTPQPYVKPQPQLEKKGFWRRLLR